MKIKLWPYILLFITACSSLSPEKNSLTPAVAITDSTSSPTSTSIPPTETPLPTFTSVPIEPFSINALRMVYVKEGNIYLRDGLNTPKQLTFSGHDRDPILSDDGQKIVFYRGEEDEHVYSINADGSNELLIIESKSFHPLSQGQIEALTFVPNSHLMLFNTYLCNPNIPGSYNAPDCIVGLFQADINTGENDVIVTGLSGNRLQKRNFEISPDGQWISVAASGYVDIYHMNNPLAPPIYPGAISYDRTFPDEFLPGQYWLPDSSGIIVVVAADGSSNEPTTPPSSYTVFSYDLQNNRVLQIPMDKEILWGFGSKATSWSISPDRNWISFINDGKFWVGNLSSGQVQILEGMGGDIYFFNWSTDNKHFAFSNNTGHIGDIGGTLIPHEGIFMEWLDPTHYIYESEGAGYKIGEIGAEGISLPDDFTLPGDFVVLDPSLTP